LIWGQGLAPASAIIITYCGRNGYVSMHSEHYHARQCPHGEGSGITSIGINGWKSRSSRLVRKNLFDFFLSLIAEENTSQISGASAALLY
jgi:hypothetical protein